MAVSFSTISGTTDPAWLSAFQLEQPILHGCQLFNHLSTSYPAWLCAFQPSLEQPILHGCQLFNHLWGILSCMAVSFSTISGTTYYAWLSAFQASLKQFWAFEASLRHPILNGCDMAVNFFQQLWNTYPVWL